MKAEQDHRAEDLDAVNSLNGKHIQELNPSLNAFMTKMFGFIRPDQTIQCELCDPYEKPDIRIAVGQQCHYVSLKSGQSASIHCEAIRSFIPFLRSLGISEKTLKTIVRFHYGDGTLNGTGQVRQTSSQLNKAMRDQIDEANAELNKPRIIRACLRRCVFTGSELRKKKVEYLAFGDSSYYVYASRDEFMGYIMCKKFDHLYSLHIGPLLWTPFLRNINRNDKQEWRREYVHFLYPYLLSDVQRVWGKNSKPHDSALPQP